MLLHGPLLEGRSPFADHISHELFALFLTIHDRLSDILKVLKVEVERPLDELVLRKWLLLEHLCNAPSLILGQLLEHVPLAPATPLIINPGCTVCGAAVLTGHAFIDIPVVLPLVALHSAVLPRFACVAFGTPTFSEWNPFATFFVYAPIFPAKLLFFPSDALSIVPIPCHAFLVPAFLHSSISVSPGALSISTVAVSIPALKVLKGSLNFPLKILCNLFLDPLRIVLNVFDGFRNFFNHVLNFPHNVLLGDFGRGDGCDSSGSKERFHLKS